MANGLRQQAKIGSAPCFYPPIKLLKRAGDERNESANNSEESGEKPKAPKQQKQRGQKRKREPSNQGPKLKRQKGGSGQRTANSEKEVDVGVVVFFFCCNVH
jgi:hypothetical protein